jgi:hypothetical protein
MKAKLFFFLFPTILFLSNSITAQHTPPPTKQTTVSIVSNPVKQTVNIEFIADKEISNLLVVLTDSKGNTLFLDNRYRFKGIYKKDLDLTQSGKGDYSLQIINDEEKINKTLTMQ